MMSASDDKWMQGAVKPSHRGLFTKKADRAGKSVPAFASEHAGDSGTLGKEARLAQTFEGVARKKQGLAGVSRA